MGGRDVIIFSKINSTASLHEIFDLMSSKFMPRAVRVLETIKPGIVHKPRETNISGQM